MRKGEEQRQYRVWRQERQQYRNEEYGYYELTKLRKVYDMMKICDNVPNDNGESSNTYHHHHHLTIPTDW
jgi:hypothetical protein